MSRLPDKPSDLLKLALKCLRDCEQDIDYQVDMDYFHAPGDYPGWPTRIDLAGAVAAHELGAQKGEYYGHAEFPADDAKLDALVIFYSGDVSIALELLGHKDFHSMDFEPLCYAADRDAWHDQMNSLVKKLEGLGI